MKARIWLAMLMFLPAMGGLAQGGTITVCWDGSGDYTTIQAGIDAAVNGDEVVICEGTYTGPGNRDLDFSNGLPEGQTRAITVRSTDPNKLDVVATTIIDCNGTRFNPHRGFYFHNGEGLNSVVAGFTIKNGYASDYGGGIYCYESRPTISNCTFTVNSAHGGGGMYNYSSSPILINCIFHGNSAGHGGGMFNEFSSHLLLSGCTFISNSAEYNGGGMLNRHNSHPTLTNCTFRGNTAMWGGGMYNRGNGSPELINCIFSNNSANYANGGGMWNKSSVPLMTNCMFSGNSAEDYGGGMYNWDSSPLITNCTFSGNSASGGGGIYSQENDGHPKLTNCILWGNTATHGDQIHLRCSAIITVSYSDIENGQEGVYIGDGSTLNWGDGNIEIDPLFVDPNNGDYHLLSESGRYLTIYDLWVLDEVSSPCIDGGDPTFSPSNEWKPNGGRINMGIYGGTTQASRSKGQGEGDINRDGRVDMTDFAILLANWLKCEPGTCDKHSEVYITWPRDSTMFFCPLETIGIEAEAYAADGSMVKVEFFIDGIKIGEDNDGSDGWKINWDDHAEGTYSLTAKATDDDGATTTSPVVAITVLPCGP